METRSAIVLYLFRDLHSAFDDLLAIATHHLHQHALLCLHASLINESVPPNRALNLAMKKKRRRRGELWSVGERTDLLPWN